MNVKIREDYEFGEEGIFLESMIFEVIREDCQKVSSSQKENGLLEIVVPKKCDDKEIVKYIKGFNKEEYDNIVNQQKKTKEVFRKKIKKMINKYTEEFNLPLIVKLRLETKTNKLLDYKVEVHGIIFEGNLMIAMILQYFADELVEKIIKGAVYEIACEYEERFNEMKGIRVSIHSFPDGKIISNECYNVSEEKYYIPVEDSEIQKIKSDYESAARQVCDTMKRRRIMQHTR